ncbi:tetratricopeptide repeat protein [Archangium lansingense]|uniref:Tetratricopeptide repeat protein n=1 Tax=Archangium lansingense TaxID=2995310 RepID=A0ABT4AEJ3_9BACT|nr:tetratricopeptide repeat protein [Archangium lansinium]MCY1080093.1 tetratricopeptide repeat protein [Archangium lansinium]
MQSKLPRLLYVLPLMFPLACKDPDTLSVQTREQTFQAKMNEGQALLSSGEPEQAARAFEAASGLMPDNPEPLLLIAEARRREGNQGASILALKRAMTLNPGQAPEIKRKLAERHEEDGRTRDAINVLLELREADELRDLDVLRLARLQTREGQHKAAFQTLERIQRDRPDDVDAKVVEAEILLAKGEEVLAGKLMDRLLEEQPGLTAARLLRANFFLRNGYAEYAEQDLASVQGEEATKPEFVTLKVRVLTKLERHADAEAVLAAAVAKYPQNADLIARLAETRLTQGNKAGALTAVEQALKAQPDSARALYIRGRVHEAQGDMKRAKEDYGFALQENGRLVPALSRMWRLQREAGEKEVAMDLLERLHGQGEASLEEKVALASLYAETRRRPEQGLKLIAEALKQDPGNFEYQDIQKALKKALPKKKQSGPIIMRGRR